MAIVSLARARYHPACTRVSDALLTAALLAAEEKIIQLAGQTFETTAHTDFLTGTGSRSIWLKQLPVSDITSITFTDDYGTGIDTVVDPDDCDFNPSTGEVRFLATSEYLYWPEGWRCIEIVYNAGYATPPESVIEAIIMLALGAIEQNGSSNHLRLGSANAGEYRAGLQEAVNLVGIPDFVKQVIHDHKVPGGV